MFYQGEGEGEVVAEMFQMVTIQLLFCLICWGGLES